MADGSFLSVMNCHWIESCHVIYPICSMYGIFTYIYPTNGPNVDKYIYKYTIHGAYGYCKLLFWKTAREQWYRINSVCLLFLLRVVDVLSLGEDFSPSGAGYGLSFRLVQIWVVLHLKWPCICMHLCPSIPHQYIHVLSNANLPMSVGQSPRATGIRTVVSDRCGLPTCQMIP